MLSESLFPIRPPWKQTITLNHPETEFIGASESLSGEKIHIYLHLEPTSNNDNNNNNNVKYAHYAVVNREQMDKYGITVKRYWLSTVSRGVLIFFLNQK